MSKSSNRGESNKRGSNKRGRGKGRRNNYNNNGNVNTPDFNNAPSSSDENVNNSSNARGGHKPQILVSGTNNDSSWYDQLPGIKKDYAKISFSQLTGARFNPALRTEFSFSNVNSLRFDEYTAYSSQSAHYDPGIMRIGLSPVLGDYQAANYAANQLFTLVRKANSGSVNYDKTDLMMFVLAVDSLYMLYEWLVRSYRVFVTFDYLNRYIPDTLIQAMGFAPAMKHEFRNLKGTIDMLANQIGNYCIPDQFTFIHRHAWLFSNVYRDEDNGRAQMYLFCPDRLLQWHIPSSDVSDASYLAYKDITRTNTGNEIIYSSVSEIQDLIDAFVVPLNGSEDISTMNGDLTKAFGDAGLIKLTLAPEFAPIQFAHDDEVLEQIQNMDWCSCHADWMPITQNMDDLVAGPLLNQDDIRFNNTSPYTGGGQYSPLCILLRKSLLNMLDDTSEDRVMTATRYKCTWESDSYESGGTTYYYIKPQSYGTELISSVEILGFANDGSIYRQEIPQDMSIGSSTYNVGTLAAITSKFRYMPTLYLWQVSYNATTNITTCKYAGTLQNSTITHWLDADTITNLNRVAVMSEYAVKDYNKSVQ